MGSSKMKFNVFVSSTIALLGLKSHGASTGDCPEPWVDLGYLGCFHFASEAPSMTWFDALVYCNEMNENAFLAEILEEETQLVLAALAAELPIANWWLGGSDFFVEGEWRWIKSQKLMEYSNWANGEPSNYNGNNETEDCLHFFTNSGLWNDLPCKNATMSDNYNMKPLCQLF